MDSAALQRFLRRWFLNGEESALAECLGALRGALAVPHSVLTRLGSGEVDDAREDVLIKLLDRKTGALRDAHSPLAFAREVLRRALLDRLRAQMRRSRLAASAAEELPVFEGATPLDEAALSELASRAATALRLLTAEQRLSIVLTTFAERVPSVDRPTLRGLPLSAQLPQGALSVDEASALLFGAPGVEEEAARRQRIDRFHKLRNRALTALRRRLLEDP